jgi:hypothetical protein
MTNGTQPVSDPSSPPTSTEPHLADVAVEPLNLHDYETAARAVLPQMNYDYIARAAGDEVTLSSNRAVRSVTHTPSRSARRDGHSRHHCAGPICVDASRGGSNVAQSPGTPRW